VGNRLSIALGIVLAYGVATAWVTRDSWAVYCLYGAVFVLGAVYLAALLIAPEPVLLNPLLLAPVITAGWGIVQLIGGVSVNPWRTANAVLLWAANATVLFLTTQLLADPRRRERFLTAMLYGGTALAAESVLQLYTSDSRIFWHFQIDYSGIIMGPVPYHNHFSALMLLLLPIALQRALADTDRWLRHSLMAAAMAGAVVASASRSGAALALAEVAAAVLLGTIRTAKPLRSRIGMALLIVGLITGGILVAGADIVWQRYHESDTTRLPMDLSSLDMIRAKPWTGFGLGTWPSAYPMFARFDDGLFSNQAHNDWLQWTSEGGVALGLLLSWFGLTLSLIGIRSIWGLGISAVLLLALVDYPLQKPIVALFFFTFAGALLAGLKPRLIFTLRQTKRP
jgi:O-antigen ligase